MPLLLGCFAVIFPRLVLFLVWLFGGGWLARAVSGLTLILGFVLMPLTTLAYAYAFHAFRVGDSITLVGWVIIALALLVDIGSWRKGHRDYSRRREPD